MNYIHFVGSTSTNILTWIVHVLIAELSEYQYLTLNYLSTSINKYNCWVHHLFFCFLFCFVFVFVCLFVGLFVCLFVLFRLFFFLFLFFRFLFFVICFLFFCFCFLFVCLFVCFWAYVILVVKDKEILEFRGQSYQTCVIYIHASNINVNEVPVGWLFTPILILLRSGKTNILEKTKDVNQQTETCCAIGQKLYISQENLSKINSFLYPKHWRPSICRILESSEYFMILIVQYNWILWT